MLYSSDPTLNPFFEHAFSKPLQESHDTRVDGEVKVKKRKKRKKRLFKLSAMNKLVDENSFLKNKYDKLSAGAEEKLGYHWNEVVQNILFNKYVKPEETLMGRYLEIKRRDEAEHDQEKAGHPSTNKNGAADTHEHDPPEPVDTEIAAVAAPIAPLVPVPNAQIDTRLTTESTDTISAGNYQHSGPLVTTKGGMNAWMKHWESKIKNDKSGMTIIRETHNMVQNAFKKLNESGNPLANPALLDALFEGYTSDALARGDKYLFFVVAPLNGANKILGGNEFKQDAQDTANEYLENPQGIRAKVYTGSFLKSKGIDPNEDTNWASQPEITAALGGGGDEGVVAEGDGTNEQPTGLHDTFVIASDGKIITSVDSKNPEFYAQVAQIMRDQASLKPQVVKADAMTVDANDDANWVQGSSQSGDSQAGDTDMFEDAPGEPIGHPEDLAQLNREKGAIAMDRVFNHPEDRQRDADFQKLHKKEPIVAADAKHLTQNVGVNEMDSLGANAQHVGPMAKGKAAFLKEGDAKPAALVQLDRLHKETEKASNGYYKKDQKDRNLNMKAMGDGTTVQQHDYDSDSMKHKDVPMHHTTTEQEKYVKLNRGGNLADRAIQGIKDMPKAFLDRMKDEAGADVVKDAEDKKKEIDKVKPALTPPARTQIVKESVAFEPTLLEGVVLTARYMTPFKRSVIAFNTTKAEKINALNEKFTPLETKGFGNDATPGAKTIIAENDFFIDLGNNQIYVLEKRTGTLNESVSLKKNEYDRLRKLITYNPGTWNGTR